MSTEEMVKGKRSKHRNAAGTAEAPKTKGRVTLSVRKPTDSAFVPTAPRVSLLPPEVKAAGRGRSTRRRLVAGVIGVGVIALVASGGATAYSLSAGQQSATAQTSVSALTAQIANYTAVTKLESGITLGKAAVLAGSSTAIDWQKVMNEVYSTMPAGYTVTGVTLDSGSPIKPYTQTTVPLETNVVASVIVLVKASSIDDLPAWLTDLQHVKGYVDAAPSVSGEHGTFDLTVTLHLNDAAYVTPVAKGTTR